MHFRHYGRVYLAGALLFLFLFNLGACPITERSEARYVEIAWEMLRSGDVLTPKYNGIAHFHKPPLFYWTIALSMKIFGAGEWAARVPTTLAALLVVCGTWLFARKSLGMNERESLWGGTILACNPFFWEMARVAVTDMLLTLFICLSLFSGWELLKNGRGVGWVFVFWISLALSFLTKGPVGLLIICLVLVPYCIRYKLSPGVLRPGFGVLAFLLLAIPWYLWACWTHPGLLEYFLKFQTVDRLVSTAHHREGSMLFYFPVILGGFLPWTALFLGALWRSGKTVFREDEVEAFLLLWIALPLIFFSLIGSKLPPYVLPVFPALALLTARHLDRIDLRFYSLSGLSPVIAGVAGLLQVQYQVIPRLAHYQTELLLGSVVLLAGGVTVVVLSMTGHRGGVLKALLGTSLLLLFLADHAYPKAEYRTAKPMADAILRYAHQRDFEVGFYRYYLFGLPYYLHQEIVHVGHPRELEFELDKEKEALVVGSLEEYLWRFRDTGKVRFLVLAYPDWFGLRNILRSRVVFWNERYVVVVNNSDN